jgi:hypothetical protein
MVGEEDAKLGKADGAGEGDHERADGGLREVAEAKTPTFDWVVGKEIGQVGKLSRGIGEAANEAVGGGGEQRS